MRSASLLLVSLALGASLAAAGTRGPATVAREDSALWRVVAPGGAGLVRYRVRVPKEDGPRGALPARPRRAIV